MKRLRDWFHRPTKHQLDAVTEELIETHNRVTELEYQIHRSRREREPDAISDTWQSVTVWPEDIRPWLNVRTPMGFDHPYHYTFTIRTVLRTLLDQVFTCARCTEDAGIRDRLWRPVTDVDPNGDRHVTFYTVCTLCLTPIRHAEFHVEWGTKTADITYTTLKA